MTGDGVRALVLVGGPHHDPPGAREALVEALTARGGVRVTLADDVAALNEAALEEHDVLVIYSTGAVLPAAQEAVLLGAVERGLGLAGIHCAADTFRESVAYRRLLGGRFASHPPFGDVAVRVVDAEHAVTRGLADFALPDELYVLDYDGENVRVLARAVTGAVDQPAAYVKRHGAGRVFYTSLGHSARSFASEGFRRLASRGVRWAGGAL